MVRYEADNTIGKWVQPLNYNPHYRKVRSGLLILKAAARICLTVTGVKAEQLMTSAPEEAIRKGIQKQVIGINQGFSADKDSETVYRVYSRKKQSEVGNWASFPVTSFKSLLGLLHGRDSWQRNSWVWVLEFQLIKPLTVAPLAL